MLLATHRRAPIGAPGYGRGVPVLAAAFCPHPPLLVPELAGAAAPELDGLRAACDKAVAAIVAYGVPVLVLGRAPDGSSPRTYGSAPRAPSRHGVPRSAGGDGPAELPLSLTIGAWLLDRAGSPWSSGLPRRLGPPGDRAAELEAVAAATTTSCS